MSEKEFGTYTYQHPVYDTGGRVYNTFTMRVEIVGAKGNRHHIRYLGQHANGAALNSLHWVRKDKVAIDGEPVVQSAMRKLLDTPRLPYKD